MVTPKYTQATLYMGSNEIEIRVDGLYDNKVVRMIKPDYDINSLDILYDDGEYRSFYNIPYTVLYELVEEKGSLNT
ncbi:hypothetical protein [Listeria booriae]|uniref:hypothetical protein n=1 Tax=Listeria booriae TaxID=1552123 RepID=UPI0016235BAA|nr:hypothetical protein [Listeria booriae]MBC2258888.1 hypothetical protein [Listeria booriae]MBC6151043.1 hypothetical protein [Listeria booriae]MBC6151208.1 hypothetical protein [Listeria booriae]